MKLLNCWEKSFGKNISTILRPCKGSHKVSVCPHRGRCLIVWGSHSAAGRRHKPQVQDESEKNKSSVVGKNCEKWLIRSIVFPSSKKLTFVFLFNQSTDQSIYLKCKTTMVSCFSSYCAFCRMLYVLKLITHQRDHIKSKMTAAQHPVSFQCQELFFFFF